MFAEDWPRYVLKMATGAGKTKVLSLLIAWSYFHRLYEADSALARNFLLIAPNIIVLDRLRTDFDGLKIFFNDPVLPDNGHEGRNWRDDFQIALHIQDDVRMVRDTGNLFLTNIHRVYPGRHARPSLEDDDLRDYFLSRSAPTSRQDHRQQESTSAKSCARSTNWRCSTTRRITSTTKMAWFKSHPGHPPSDAAERPAAGVADRRHRHAAARQRRDLRANRVSDYPLVEAIHQNVVKHPVLPDAASRRSLAEQHSAIFHEKYADYLELGIEEWRRATPNTTGWARRRCCS